MIYDDVPNFEGKFYYTPRLVIKNGLKLYLFQLNVFGMMEKKNRNKKFIQINR
jgi:hypothetical protein